MSEMPIDDEYIISTFMICRIAEGWMGHCHIF